MSWHAKFMNNVCVCAREGERESVCEGESVCACVRGRERVCVSSIEGGYIQYLLLT